MSITITITGNESVLKTEFNPPLILDTSYECGLLYFSTYNSIPNISEKNNTFSYGKDKKIKIPTGTYDLLDLRDYLENKLKDCKLQLKANNNTLKCSLFCSEPINFAASDSLGPLLGFSQTLLEPNKWHDADFPVSITPVSLIRIECDFIQGSFTNGLPSHIIHEFVLNATPADRIIETPNNVIYFPVRKRYISSVTIKILDLKGNLINFNNEKIYLCLHLRKSTC